MPIGSVQKYRLEVYEPRSMNSLFIASRRDAGDR